MLLSLPAFAGGAETDAETCSPIWEEIGLPSIPEDSAEVPVTVCHKGYILGHSTTNRTPDWAIERVTRAIAEGRNSRPGNSFSVETLPDGILGSRNDDYKNSGFDRGHQAPSNDFKSSLKLMEDLEAAHAGLAQALPDSGLDQAVPWTANQARRQGLWRPHGQ
jgi:endonuclease G